MAMGSWIKVVPADGFFDAFPAAGVIPDPEWPELTYNEILKLAFKGRPMIDSFDHLVMKNLRGE